MDRTYISWTPTNWVTIFLMAAGGFVIAKAIIMGVKKVSASKGAASA